VSAARWLAAFLACASPMIAAAQSFDVRAELWDRPRTAVLVAADPSVRQAVLEMLRRPQSRLVIRHAAGQEALLQAEELRSWLGALAIDPRRTELRGDLNAGAQIKLEVTS
jgi:hypothetical protein